MSRASGGGYTLPSGFWARFVSQVWDRRPVRIERPLLTPLATLPRVFATLVQASKRFRAGDPEVKLRFYTEHAMQQADVGRYLPEPADASLSGYAERVSRLTKERAFGLVVNEYQVHDAETWLRLREFLGPLYERVGIPIGFSDAVLFVGNYDATPFGVHQDASSNLTFVLEGRKRIRTWPDGALRGRPAVRHTTDYAALLPESLALDGVTGDVLYWPASYWHVGEPVGGLSVTLSLPMFRATPQGELLGRVLSLVEERLKEADGPHTRPTHPNRLEESARALPRVLDHVTRALATLAGDPRLAETVRVAWMRRVTSFGFDRVPPPRPPRRLADEEIVRVDPRYPVVWAPIDARRVACSANGHAFAVAAHPGVPALLHRLNTGEACRVGDLVQRYAAAVARDGVELKGPADDVRALLAKLWSLRALSCTSGTPRRVQRAAAALGDSRRGRGSRSGTTPLVERSAPRSGLRRGSRRPGPRRLT